MFARILIKLYSQNDFLIMKNVFALLFSGGCDCVVMICSSNVYVIAMRDRVHGLYNYTNVPCWLGGKLERSQCRLIPELLFLRFPVKNLLFISPSRDLLHGLLQFVCSQETNRD